MNKLKRKIENSGIILSDKIIKVDSFINQKVDINLLAEIANEFVNKVSVDIDYVVTVESGGIAPATLVALALKKDLIILKKGSSILSGESYTSIVKSFTKQTEYVLQVNKTNIIKNKKWFFIDDFLASGSVYKGVKEIAKQAECSIGSIGIIIEKSFDKGRKLITNDGIELISLAKIKTMTNNVIVWND